MGRLVDADAFKQTFCAECVASTCENCRINYHFEHLAPTVDPVKHGDWTSSQGLAEVGEVQCSNCKTIYYVGDLYDVGETDENGMGQALMPNYCPHCGAKMDEVGE